ncbi:Stk1 family PASTA domain-containing Ser/Thr kinase [Apilactobacillus sp. EABW-1NA]|uniref:Stk1 family PASTA domain-containing Ser/Thr kinase n=1 Tax=Apilactobacillus sp. EABW-1NA TaxID=2984137 RepID=UPI0025B151A7|nr:Stk1 family PASTA domain-containing Ser/Thr kinase [Apilactobacillus sp. EABW-1NA]MDN2612113.1 Stk1 family PASTA domain-containing Ser/Thr kinase [Apilactobacillus sp. EABW-1NA]
MEKGCVLNDRYKIIDKIGEGGMVNVYLSYDMKENRLVTIKIIRIDFQGSQKAKRHFKYEKLAINKLKSKHIAQVYDLNQSGDLQYLVTEYVDGQDLKNYIQKYYPISIDKVIAIMTQLIDAVYEAHSHGIIHRDLKPQNVLIDKKGVVKVTDFGIALIENQNALTQTNAVVGSIHYISPEQALGKKVTTQSDVYSLGIILYELLTGKVPFDGDSPVNIAMKHTKENLPSIIEQNSLVTQALENVVIKATAKKLSDRYSSVLDMKEDLLTSMNEERMDEAKLHFMIPKTEIDDGETKVLELKDLNKYHDHHVGDEHEYKDKYRIFKLLTLIVILFAFISGIFLFFNFTFFTRVTVPNVSNMSISKAKKVLKKSHLIVSKVKYTYNTDVAVNKVIGTNPAKGTKMINHSGIVLKVSGGYKKVKMDNYLGDSVDSAEHSLTTMGFTVKKSYSYDTSFKSDTILSQSIRPGTLVEPHNTTINLVVAVNTRNFKMVNLIGKTEEQARNYAKENHLNVKAFYENSKSQSAGKVYQQSPSTGLLLSYGDEVELWVSKGNSDNKNLRRSVNVSVKLTYKKVDNSGLNKITIYSNKDGGNEKFYRTIYINKDTTISIPYSLKKNQKPQYRIYRNGDLIMK